MIAFTILGLIVFWCWCFQLGYALAFGAQIAHCLLWVFLLERRSRRLVDVYCGWLVANAQAAEK